MKKCSISAHHTLTELNITPLLDLAFVLLVIFILTTTPIANDIDLKLPDATRHQKDPPHMAHYITVQADGTIWLDKARLDASGLQNQLLNLRIDDPDISVIIRGDSKTRYRQIRNVMDVCQQVNVTKVDLATEAADKKE
ncbi:MAG TPA: biopolymer transporter ExbD [Candidatus Saccharimonadales bacterium]|jgi:biopolymer transport protein ExbD|nr:biopolymer transporter ExbD [Candidatus Saccharimonadales bacterium]